MPDRTHAKDNSSLHKCRIELPNLIDDMGLDVYTFRVYVHLKRVAGEDGSCWQSTRTIATICGISQGKVAQAKEELERRGLITRQTRTTRGGQVDDITIADLWPENFRKYASGSDPVDESVHVVSTSASKRSRGEHFDESVHVVSTSDESAQVVNALTSKRTRGVTEELIPSHEKDHDPPPPPLPPNTQNGGGGGRKKSEPDVTETESYLLSESFLAETAREFADLPIATARYWVPRLKKDGLGPGAIVKQWRRQLPPPPKATATDYRPPAVLGANAPTKAEARAVWQRAKAKQEGREM